MRRELAMAPRRLLAAVSLCCAWLALPGIGRASDEAPGGARRVGADGGVWIPVPRSDAALAALAPGFQTWLGLALGDLGLAVSLGGADSAERVREPQQAGARGASVVLRSELARRSSGAEVVLALAPPGARAPIRVARESAAVAQIGEAIRSALERLLPGLGVQDTIARLPAPPAVEELAIVARAQSRLAAGDAGSAWKELGGSLWPSAIRLREALELEARAGGYSAAERARVLAGSGDRPAAWHALDAALAEPAPAPAVLCAAAELALAEGNLPRAEALARAAAAAPGAEPVAGDLELVLGQVHARRADLAQAEAHFARAAELHPGDPGPLLLRADLSDAADARRAPLLLEAGERAARRLDAYRSGRWLDAAARLDPALAPRATAVRARLALELGDPAAARELLERALASGSRDPELIVTLAQSLRAGGDTAAAERQLRALLARDASHAGARSLLGQICAETGRASEAVPLLRNLAGGAQTSPAQELALARALAASGDGAAGRALLESSAARDRLRGEGLQELARLQQAQGDFDAARATLERAVASDPLDPQPVRALATLLAQREDRAGAGEALALASALADAGAGAAPGAGPASAASQPAAPSFAALVDSFATRVPRAASLSAALLELRRDPALREQVWRWLHPREPDRAALEQELGRALAERFPLRDPDWRADPALRERAEPLLHFERPDSLGAGLVAELNQQLGTGALFAARLRAASPADSELARAAGSCAAQDRVELELRMLAGSQPEFVDVLANSVCLPSEAVPWRWNPRAAGLYGALLVLLAQRILRGWGSVRVELVPPPKTRGYFSIRISNRADHLPLERARKEKLTRRCYALLRRMSRWEQHMVVRSTSFGWIPARRKPYTVTLRGPLFDAGSETIIGHFLEQRPVVVERGGTARVSFDLKPKEVCIEVSIKHGTQSVPDARVALRGGGAGGIRYARDSRCYLYVGEGSYRIAIGAGDRVAEHVVEVRSLANAIPLVVDLGDAFHLVFQRCPDAVEPYLEGDLERAARALEAAGQEQAAHRLRGEFAQAVGRIDEAVAELRAAGDLERAAEVAAGGLDLAASAALFEQAGEPARAAEIYRSSGDFAAAARCYEDAYDYEEALGCYRDLGDRAKSLELLEKLGRYREAAETAREHGDPARALRNLQQIGRRDADYVQGCILAAELLAQRGDAELAVEKLEEALAQLPGAGPSLELQRFHAELCERAGKREKAIEAWSAVRRRAPDDAVAATRLSALREQEASAPVFARPARPGIGGRYELLGEIGRGGMGVVYKARDRELGRMVALKRLPDSLREHPAAVALFRREAQAAAALNHPNIVTLFDAGEEDGSHFLTMELLEGSTLREILHRHGRLRAADVAKLGVQICAGLDYAARRQIVHRDIKTGNLFFTSDRVVKIMDFGLAKTIEEVRKHSTLIGGTPTHMAPEQALGMAVDARTDLYALGVSLYELLTGALPFSEGDLAWHHQNSAVPNPRAAVPEIPVAIAELVVQLMAKKPEDRPGTASEVAVRLRGA